jgi:hypothetical protein
MRVLILRTYTNSAANDFTITRAILHFMKAARAKVVHGKIVTRARFPEGAKLTVVMREKPPPIELSREEEDAMLRSLESIKAGKGTPLAQVHAILRHL